MRKNNKKLSVHRAARRRQTRRPGVVLRFAMLAIGLCFAAASCVSDKNQIQSATSKSNGPVWPPAPDEPRIAYLQSLSQPRDVGQTRSIFGRIGGWITGETGQSLALEKPCGLAVDERGNLSITDTGANRICYCDFANKRWRTYDSVGKTRFASPVAVCHRNGMFYVADSQLARLIVFDDSGKLSWEHSTPMLRPAGLTLTEQGLAVVDSQAHAVFLFDLNGNLLSQFGKRGVEAGEFNFPTHITSDRKGHLLVTDSMNCRVQIFDSHGNFVSQFGSNGDTSGHFSRPKGVAVDSFEHVYVADAVFDNVQIFDLQGRLLLNVGHSGVGPGEFGLPGGVAIDSDNRIYVADGYNHRVQVLKYIGQP